MVNTTDNAASSGTIEGVVRNARIVTFNVHFADTFKERTLILEDGVDLDDVLKEIAKAGRYSEIACWDQDWGSIGAGRGRSRRMLARWATTYCERSPKAVEVDAVVPQDDYGIERTVRKIQLGE